MPAGDNMRTSISTQREIVRLITKNRLSNRAAAKRSVVTHKTVASIRAKLRTCSLGPTELLKLEDAAFIRHLGTAFKPQQSDRILPDWPTIQKQLQLKDMTLALLWEEYRLEHYVESDRCLSYSRFSQLFSEWLNCQKISMRQLHKPAEKLFMDFCGRTVPITDKDTGELTYANIFVAVLGASNYMFVYATPSMKTTDWIRGSVAAFEYFGGTTEQIIPDNPKTTVIVNTPEKIIINREFADFARHYDVIVNPARPRRPKDKSLAEISVQIVQRWLLAAMRNYTFFSIDDLNAEIAKKLQYLNSKKTKTFPSGRAERFKEIEREFLLPLPIEQYETALWRYKVRVPNDYHIEYKGCYYSVPYQHIKKHVDLRVTARVIEIILEGRRIASHEIQQASGSISRKQEHMPAEHLFQFHETPESLLEWAESIGPNVLEWATQNIKNRSDFANGLKSVSNLRKWARVEQNFHRLDSACAYALKIGVLPFQNLKNIITKNGDLRDPAAKPDKVIDHENIRGADYYKTEGEEDAQ
jgi:transposase